MADTKEHPLPQLAGVEGLSLKSYVGVKALEAAPCSLGEYNLRRGWKLPEGEDATRPGYIVQYNNDGYISWSPAEIFEQSYLHVPSNCVHSADALAETLAQHAANYVEQTA